VRDAASEAAAALARGLWECGGSHTGVTGQRLHDRWPLPFCMHHWEIATHCLCAPVAWIVDAKCEGGRDVVVPQVSACMTDGNLSFCNETPSLFSNTYLGIVLPHVCEEMFVKGCCVFEQIKCAEDGAAGWCGICYVISLPQL